MKRKPIHKVSVYTMWDYKYQAKGPDQQILACDSLENLKKEIRENTNWDMAWLTCRNGSFSYGQNIVDEYPYCPRKT